MIQQAQQPIQDKSLVGAISKLLQNFNWFKKQQSFKQGVGPTNFVMHLF